MRNLAGLVLFCAACLSAVAQASAVEVTNIRLWPAPDHTRLVLDLSGPLDHRLLVLKDPHRIVLDLDKARLQDGIFPPPAAGPILAAVRTGVNDGALRVVLDVKSEARPRAFLLKPYAQYGYRLVVDLFDAAVPEETRVEAPPAPKTRDLVIAIDAGHGGEDPGAIGRRGTREKEVVLAIARQLERMINATPGMKAYLVRDGDYYIPLRRRIDRARRFDPDVFISIHADAVPGRNQARGSSVYVLSERGATREAAYLADRENAADLIGGVSFNDKDDLLSKVLVDMSQAGTISSSLELGEDLLAELKRVGPVHAAQVGQAGFMVLRSPYIPSVLIETAFISNPDEERKLRDPRYQRKIAQGILNGLRRAAPRLLARRGLPQTVAATSTAGAREHVVRAGETLDAIAKRYGVHKEVLLFANDVKDGDALTGRRLRIPSAAEL